MARARPPSRSNVTPGTPMLWLLVATLTAPAQADTFHLANGSTVEGTLATYELAGNCEIFVSDGPVRGSTLLLPCTEIRAFSRPSDARSEVAVAPIVVPAAPVATLTVLPAEPVAAPAPLVVPISPAEQAPQAVELPPEPAPAPAPQAKVAPAGGPVTASLPPGYTLPGDDALAEEAPPAPAGPSPDNLRGAPRPAPRLDGAAAAPAQAAPADAAAADEAPPEGWHNRGQGQLPRWLNKALYGTTTGPVKGGTDQGSTDQGSGNQ